MYEVNPLFVKSATSAGDGVISLATVVVVVSTEEDATVVTSAVVTSAVVTSTVVTIGDAIVPAGSKRMIFRSLCNYDSWTLKH